MAMPLAAILQDEQTLAARLLRRRGIPWNGFAPVSENIRRRGRLRRCFSR